MPDLIDSNIEIFNEITKVYETEVKEDLDHEAKELVKRLKKILDQNSRIYNLETLNDVNPIKYYSLKYRIKSKESLIEKFVRKNDGFTISNVVDLNSVTDVSTKKPLLIAELKKIPDIIGCRIVTELKHDCKQVLSLLRAHNDLLITNEILFDKIDLDSQPQKMKNGLFIYKIKGIFRGSFGFELQIKGKIEEAWGDMDHAIFYKDYSVTPIKNVTQVTMNNVGKLLDNVDEILLGLRNSSTEYQENLEQLSNLKDLNDELFPLIHKKLGISFEIEKIASFLTHLKSTALQNIDVPQRLNDLNCDFLQFNVDNNDLKKYITIRNNSFELMILEISYFSWNIQHDKFLLSHENYEEKLHEYLSIFFNNFHNVIEKENSAIAAEIGEGNLINTVLQYSYHIKNHDLYLSEKTLINIVKIESTVEEFFQDKEDLFVDGVDANEFKSAFKKLYVIEALGYSSQSALDELKRLYEKIEDEISSTLDSIAYDFKEYLRKNEENTRADLKVGDTIKKSILTIHTAEKIITMLTNQ
ncbi:hypothetical protein [Chryseobacterium sp. MEBOG07]|uniref:hypothetical protein n=1 Tax=Chryseobacterium sp. MEBOG07 TaxID=2879939 RepID=UPI001F32216F|nr:hypothetical protein [Chryseobacterium sp. MEBOG07]UKB81292.1 hypothetical protein LF886_09960 [Chryseobacterium sp. MEBOG07]